MNPLRILLTAALSAASLLISAQSMTDKIICVDDNGQFRRGDSLYTFHGTNYWYGPILASETPAGDYELLCRDLDSLKAMGITNLRVLAGAEGPEGLTHHIAPVLQTAPGVYNEALLRGLDRFMAELERRDMTAVLYLTNAWEWSGGYGSYLQWAGHGVAPDPTDDGYNRYVDHVAKFILDPKARDMAVDHARFMASRVNSVTGRPYSESPALMAWQVANEPRAFSNAGKQALHDWILDMARAIKSSDPNHMVSTGSEGSVGCQLDLDLWTRIHEAPEIDYAVIHLWPTNWGWASRDSVEAHLPQAIDYCREYVMEHVEAIRPARKPLVIEEFGYPRNGFKFERTAPVTARDGFYRFVVDLCASTPEIAGFNFWGYSGDARPRHQYWQQGDPFLCDPAHEPQGMYSVFSTDPTTLQILRR